MHTQEEARPGEPPDPGHLERFCQLVLQEPGLHQALRETSEPETFIALAVRLGRERGCLFTAVEVRAALQQRRREWLERWI